MKARPLASCVRTNLLSLVIVACGLLASAGQSASAVVFEGSQTAPGEWTYTLTYNAWDNYSITQPSSTITLSGLTGVVSATGPTSTDFPYFPGSTIEPINLAWTPEVLVGGTQVQWTHVGPGTGNFSTDIHVFGFKVLAPSAFDGSVAWATDGFSTDTDRGLFERDASGTTRGPAVPEPSTAALGLVGLAALAVTLRRRTA